MTSQAAGFTVTTTSAACRYSIAPHCCGRLGLRPAFSHRSQRPRCRALSPGKAYQLCRCLPTFITLQGYGENLGLRWSSAPHPCGKMCRNPCPALRRFTSVWAAASARAFFRFFVGNWPQVMVSRLVEPPMFCQSLPKTPLPLPNRYLLSGPITDFHRLADTHTGRTVRARTRATAYQACAK